MIDGCKANSRASQRTLYMEFFPKMEAMVRRYTHDEDQIISILNDGFLKVFKKIEQYSGSGSFEGWIRRLVFSSLSDYFRKENKYLKFLIFESAEKQAPANANDNLYYQDILQLTELLPQATKKVFHKYAIEGYSHKDIANELSISEGTSKWHLSEARKKMRELIDKRNAQDAANKGIEYEG